MLGTSVCTKFKTKNYNLIPVTKQEVDLRNSVATFEFFSKLNIDLVIHCAALVGGIQANIEGGSNYFLDNIQIDSSVISAARHFKIKNFIYIGSSCMYPANLVHPIKESELLSGPLEPTNENYALAKIFGSRMVTEIAKENNLNWRVFVASNLYGPHDKFNSKKSHILAAVISKAVYAKEHGLNSIEMWGDGTPKREFTYVEDMADWINQSYFNLEKFPYILNVGFGTDYSILDIYKKVLDIMNLKIAIIPNAKKPKGNFRKLMDSSVARSYGWNPKVDLDRGISDTLTWYMSNKVL